MRAVFLLLLMLLPGIGQRARADEARDSRWRQDLSYLATELPRRHANLFFLMPREGFEQAAAELMDAIPSLSDPEIVTGLARLAAMAGDAHTSLRLPQAAAGFRSLPLSLYWHQDGLYVRSAASQYARAVGTRVVGIGEQTAEDARQAVAAAISNENDFWVLAKSPAYLVMPDVLRPVKVTSQDGPVPFTFEELSGERFTLDIDYDESGERVSLPASNGFVPLMSRDTGKPYWYTYLADSRTLYFKYNMCQDNMSEPFSGFAAGMLAEFDTQPADRWIIDLRNNPGGNTSVLDPLLRGLQARQRWFGGTRLYVLTNRGTFSSAMLNTVTLKRVRDEALAAGVAPEAAGVFLGEPTGGNPTVPWRNGAVLTLPNSRLQIQYTTTLARTSYQHRGAVDPDIFVTTYSSDEFARHDPVLAAALADSRGDPPSEDSAITVLNSASLRPGAPVAPGSLASAFGDFGDAGTVDASGFPLPVQLGETQLLVNGTAAPLAAIRPGRITFQIPASTPAGTAAVTVVRGGETVVAGSMRVVEVGPGLFSSDPLNPARPGAISHADGSSNSESNRARAGEEIRILGTGQGATDPEIADGQAGEARSLVEPRVFIGSVLAEVLSSGAPAGAAGIWEIRVRVPGGLAGGQYPVFVAAGGAASNGVTLWIADSEVPY